jgi:hypothetical protein
MNKKKPALGKAGSWSRAESQQCIQVFVHILKGAAQRNLNI